MFNFFKKKIVTEDQFPQVIDKLVGALDKAQETAMGNIDKVIEDLDIGWKHSVLNFNSDVIEALYGYQITCLVGFSTEEKLIQIQDILKFREKLLEKIGSINEINTKLIEDYNQRYLDCGGDIPCLNEKFRNDMVKLYEIPTKNKKQEIIGFLEDLSVTFALQTQYNTAKSFGDNSLKKQLFKRFEQFLKKESYASKHKSTIKSSPLEK